MELKSLLLDLDGTLVDTAPDMVGALDRVLQNHGQAVSDYEISSKLVSNGGKALIEHGFGEQLEDYDTEQLLQEFLSTYKQHVADNSIVYAGMDQVLSWCEERDIAWGVITNKPLHLAKDLLAGLCLLDRCKILLGGDSLPVKKPDPVPLLHASMLLNYAPSQCLYVGDHERDIQAANAAGMDSAVALWGYIQADHTPEDWQAKYLLNSTSGLLQLIQERVATETNR